MAAAKEFSGRQLPGAAGHDIIHGAVAAGLTRDTWVSHFVGDKLRATELFSDRLRKQFCLIDYSLDYSGKFRHVCAC
jgi:hypothetical protein